MKINPDITTYNAKQSENDKKICDLLMKLIDKHLPATECKIWYGHPVWFIDGNPIVGYSKLKESIRLLFWSGQSFKEKGLMPEGSFKAAEVRYTKVNQVKDNDVIRWLTDSKNIQWDYKNIVKRKGELLRLK